MTHARIPARLGSWLLPRIARAERLAGTAIGSRLADLGISYAHFRLIGHLLDAPDGLSQKALAARMGLDPSSVSVALSALESRGFISRARDGADRRTVIVKAAIGAGALETALSRAEAVETALNDALSAEEAAQLASLLDRAAVALAKHDLTENLTENGMSR